MKRRQSTSKGMAKVSDVLAQMAEEFGDEYGPSPARVWNGLCWSEFGKDECLVPKEPKYKAGEYDLVKDGKYWGGLRKNGRDNRRPVWTVLRDPEANDNNHPALGPHKHSKINDVLRLYGLMVVSWDEPIETRMMNAKEIKWASDAVKRIARAA